MNNKKQLIVSGAIVVVIVVSAVLLFGRNEVSGAMSVNNVVTDVADSTPISYNAGTEYNRILTVAIAMAWEEDNAIRPMTYGGVAFTKAESKSDPWTWGRIEMWYLIDPASGTNDLVFDTDDNSVAPVVISYISGVDSIGAINTKNGESSTPNADITPTESHNIALSIDSDGWGTISMEIKGAMDIEELEEHVTVDITDRDYVDNLRESDNVVSVDGFVRTYLADEKSLKVENTAKTKMVEIELESSYNIMVPAGESVKVAEVRLKDWTDRTEMFDSLNFYNIENEYQSTSTPFAYKYAEDVPVEYCYIEEVSQEEICFNEDEPDWDNAVAFDSLAELPYSDIAVGVFASTTLGEKIEWIPTIDGFQIYEWAAYDVTELNVLEHDEAIGSQNSLVKIDSTHFILAYTGSDVDGYIKTFSIDGSYNITEIDVLEHDEVEAIYNSLVMLDSTHFMLAYEGDDNVGYVKTFSIDGSYDNIAQIDIFNHGTNNAFNSLVMIDSTHTILACTGGGTDGFMRTFSVDGSFDNIAQIDELEHDGARGTNNSLAKIDATHFSLAYAGPDNDGFIKTFSIDGAYDNITEIDSLEHDPAIGLSNSLVLIDSTHLILAWTGPDGDGDGHIKTFSIDGAYDNIAEIDELEHDELDGAFNSLSMVDSTHFILAYTGVDGDGFIKVFSIDGSYDNITQVNSLEHDEVNGQHNSLLTIDSTHAILAYSGATGDGYIKTFSIEAPAGVVFVDNAILKIKDSIVKIKGSLKVKPKQ